MRDEERLKREIDLKAYSEHQQGTSRLKRRASNKEIQMMSVRHLFTCVIGSNIKCVLEKCYQGCCEGISKGTYRRCEGCFLLNEGCFLYSSPLGI